MTERAEHILKGFIPAEQTFLSVANTVEALEEFRGRYVEALEELAAWGYVEITYRHLLSVAGRRHTDLLTVKITGKGRQWQRGGHSDRAAEVPDE